MSDARTSTRSFHNSFVQIRVHSWLIFFCFFRFFRLFCHFSSRCIEEAIVKRAILVITVCVCSVMIAPVMAQTPQIRVSPKGANVNSQGATTVFVTFGNLGNYRPAEASWCGDLIPATPDLGFKCAPGSIYGSLPARYDQSRRSGNNAYTDIVSVTPSVARRAYQAAATGEESRFFYVRRFVSTAGGPDQFVDVTLRLTGGGARVPFSLTNVQLGFGATRGPANGDAEPLVLFLESGQQMLPVRAEITYTGTGRLKGRWEVAQPGDALPEPRDLLTEATLPIEERSRQRRYAELSRFNVFLPPTGKFTLPGPDPERFPKSAAGQYLILLRIEATDDREADSDLSAVNAGGGVVHSGGAAGFPLPVLRYIVGGASNASQSASVDQITLLLPAENAVMSAKRPLDFAWSENSRAFLYEIEVQSAEGEPLLQAMLRRGVRTYRAPSWLRSRGGQIRWRVVAKDEAGKTISESEWRSVRLIASR
jgi:hypothetical protein